MPANIVVGTPGQTWKNDTGEIYYQLEVNWANTCGVCAQNDGAVKQGSWPIPFHRHCRCKQAPILPGQSAPNPFTDFLKTIEALPPDQQKEVVGVSNWKLIQSGEVKWEDVVSPYRVRDLSEVIATKGLSVDDLIAAGVKPSVAERAWDMVHTPEIVAIEAQRKALIASLEGAGLARQDIARLGASVIAKLVGTVESPSGGIDVGLLESLLAGMPLKDTVAAAEAAAKLLATAELAAVPKVDSAGDPAKDGGYVPADKFLKPMDDKFDGVISAFEAKAIASGLDAEDLYAKLGTVQTVQIADLRAIQETVSVAGVAGKIDDPTAGGSSDLPVILKSGGEYLVFDGTHRLVAMDLLGMTETKAIVIDLDSIK